MGAFSKRFVNSTVVVKLVRPPPPFTPVNKRFPGKSMRLPHCTATIFKSGKVVLVGAKSMADIDKSVNHIGDQFGPIEHVAIRNVVASVSCDGRVDLSQLASTLKCHYNPDIYNGLVARLANGSTCIVFHTGKAIVTGCPSFEVCQESINIIADVLETAKWEHMLLSQLKETTR